MDISLCSSTLNCVKPVIFCSPSLKICKQPHNKVFAISCKATSEGQASANYYKVLSLSSNQAGAEEIKRAYRTLALKFHPDVCHDVLAKEECTQMFVLLKTAYETLSDPLSRAEYDDEIGCRDNKSGVCNEVGNRRRWEGPIMELRKMSGLRITQHEGSWGCRVRYQNRQNRTI